MISLISRHHLACMCVSVCKTVPHPQGGRKKSTCKDIWTTSSPAAQSTERNNKIKTWNVTLFCGGVRTSHKHFTRSFDSAPYFQFNWATFYLFIYFFGTVIWIEKICGCKVVKCRWYNIKLGTKPWLHSKRFRCNIVPLLSINKGTVVQAHWIL